MIKTNSLEKRSKDQWLRPSFPSEKCFGRPPSRLGCFGSSICIMMCCIFQCIKTLQFFNDSIYFNNSIYSLIFYKPDYNIPIYSFFRHKLNYNNHKVDQLLERIPLSHSPQQHEWQLSLFEDTEESEDATYTMPMSKSLVGGSIDACKTRMLTFMLTGPICPGKFIGPDGHVG